MPTVHIVLEPEAHAHAAALARRYGFRRLSDLARVAFWRHVHYLERRDARASERAAKATPSLPGGTA